MLDTKLRKFSRQWYVKLVAYLLIVACAAGFVLSGLTLMSRVTDASAFESRTYAESSVCADELERVINNVIVMQYDYSSRKNVETGSAIDEYTLYDTLYNGAGFSRYLDNRNRESRFPVDITVTNEPEKQAETQAYITAHADWNFFRDDDFVQYLLENTEEVENTKNSMIQEQLRNYTRVETFLDTIQNKYAYASYRTDGDATLKNSEMEEIRKMPIYAEYELLENGIVYYVNGNKREIMNSYYSGSDYYLSSSSYQQKIGASDKLIVGIRTDYLAQRETLWASDHNTASDCVAIMATTATLACVLFLYLLVITGRVPNKREVQLALVDRMYSEVHISVLVALACLLLISMESLIYSSGIYSTGNGVILTLTLTGIVALAVPLILSLVRSIKARRFIRSFAIGRLIIRFCAWAKRVVSGMWQSGSLMGRGIALAVLIPIASALWFTVPFVIAALMFFVYRAVKRFQAVQTGVRAVRQGDLDYKIAIKGGDLGALADDINTLSEGLETAISSEVRSERLKTELISNVSHDIKTPLTSIVTYVDLLKTELQKEAPDILTVREYAEVIERKTARLRMLTTDLFEAAKATSGAMTVALEQVDVQALVRQGLGEFDDKLMQAQLDVRVHMPEKPAYILADGRLVWRILENMLSNVVKYALPGSRVYLDVTIGHGMVTMTLKNISAYELNVPAEELMERFKRGDEARSSEGSGLGLSIAMSLAQLQKGIFSIAVDGDLFKAMLSMPQYERHAEDFQK